MSVKQQAVKCPIELQMEIRRNAPGGGSHTTVVPNPNKAEEIVFKLKLKAEFQIAEKKDAELEAIKKLSETNPEAAKRAEEARMARRSTVIPSKPCEIEISMSLRIKAGSMTSQVPEAKKDEVVFKLKITQTNYEIADMPTREQIIAAGHVPKTAA